MVAEQQVLRGVHKALVKALNERVGPGMVEYSERVLIMASLGDQESLVIEENSV